MSYKKDSQQAKRNAFGLRTIFSLFLLFRQEW